MCIHDLEDLVPQMTPNSGAPRDTAFLPTPSPQYTCFHTFTVETPCFLHLLWAPYILLWSGHAHTGAKNSPRTFSIVTACMRAYVCVRVCVSLSVTPSKTPCRMRARKAHTHIPFLIPRVCACSGGFLGKRKDEMLALK